MSGIIIDLFAARAAAAGWGWAVSAIKDAFLLLYAVGCILCALLVMAVASATGQKKRVGPWLVRGKYRLLSTLGGGL